MNKTEFNEFLKKYEPLMKKTGEQLTKAVKAAEKDIAKMYRIAQTHVELQMKNLQKEKLYHELGKSVAEKLMKGGTDAAGMEKYKTRLKKIDSEGKKIKSKLSRINEVGAKKRKKTGKVSKKK